MMGRTGLLAALTLATAGLSACGGTVTGSPAAAQGVAVDIQPQSAQVVRGGTVPFAATVTGTANTAVVWDVEEAAGGTVDANGHYTAPQLTGLYHVRATSQADASAQGVASVTVTATPVIAVSISPSSPSVQTGGTVAFTAIVTGTTNTAVTWTVQEASGCGSVTQGGAYTAPASASTCHVVATSNADPTKSAVAAVTVTAPTTGADTLQVQGRHLLDTCGNQLVIRGVEETIGLGMEVQGSWNGLVDQIALTNSNAMRFLPNMSQLSLSQIEGIIARAVSHQMVVYLSVGGANRTWFGQAATKTMLDKYKKWLILDALEEVSYDNRTTWQSDAITAVNYFRGQGYTEPLTVIANNYGRDLPSLLINGPAVVAADPLGRTILGWQSYWGSNDYWQGVYGLTLAQGINQAAQQAYPIQLGIINYTDWYIFGNSVVEDYVTAMSLAQQNNQGWLWWDYYNPFGNETSLSPTDGMANNLSAVGNVVVNTDPNSITATSRKACGQ
jgi:hypothetical protein